MRITPKRNMTLCRKLKETEQATDSGLIMTGEEGNSKYAQYEILHNSDESDYNFHVGDVVLCQREYENSVTLDGKKMYLLDAAYFSVLIGESHNKPTMEPEKGVRAVE